MATGPLVAGKLHIEFQKINIFDSDKAGQKIVWNDDDFVATVKWTLVSKLKNCAQISLQQIQLI